MEGLVYQCSLWPGVKIQSFGGLWTGIWASKQLFIEVIHPGSLQSRVMGFSPLSHFVPKGGKVRVLGE